MNLIEYYIRLIQFHNKYNSTVQSERISSYSESPPSPDMVEHFQYRSQKASLYQNIQFV